MDFETIEFRQDANGIATLALNRPDRLNSFNEQMHRDVREALSSLAQSGAPIGRASCRERV